MLTLKKMRLFSKTKTKMITSKNAWYNKPPKATIFINQDIQWIDPKESKILKQMTARRSKTPLKTIYNQELSSYLSKYVRQFHMLAKRNKR